MNSQLHHKINADLARFAAIKPKEKFYKRILEESCLRNALFDSKGAREVFIPIENMEIDDFEDQE